MLLSQDDIQSADLSFDPPMIKMAANRKIHSLLHEARSSKGSSIPRKKAFRFQTFYW